MRSSPFLALLLAAFAGGCVVSKEPVKGLGERASPVPSGTVLEIFERESADSPWKAGEQKSVRLVADEHRAYRAANADGKQEDDPIVFYALSPGRYLVEARFSPARYGYAVVQVAEGEGLLSPLDCDLVPPDRLKQAGMQSVAGDCWLDGTKDPAGFLKSLAANVPPASVKYVAQKAK